MSLWVTYQRKLTHSRGQFGYVTTRLGFLFIFPTHLDALCDILGVPASRRADCGLVGAFVSLASPSQHFGCDRWSSLPVREPRDRPLHTPMYHFPNSLEAASLLPIFRYAVHMLSMPNHLLEFLANSPDLRYHICHGPNDSEPGHDLSMQGRPGVESTLLRLVLSHFHNASMQSYKNASNMVFVHIGDLSSLCRISDVASLKKEDNHLTFFTYGTHPSVDPSRWGFREIYPRGRQTHSLFSHHG